MIMLREAVEKQASIVFIGFHLHSLQDTNVMLLKIFVDCPQ